jgi:hypothetical protein
MNRKITLVAFLFLSILGSIHAQSSEGEIFKITKRVKIFLPVAENANLEGADRFIQIGFLGTGTDVNELIGYMDRFVINDKDVVIRIEPSITEEMVDHYKFYLDPLYDANDFEKMLEMLGVEKFNHGTVEKEINSFSNTVYASIKSKNSK